MLTLYQAEWCPFSSAVRERLTELALPFVAQPVEPWPEDRASMRDATGSDEIPTLVIDGGETIAGTAAIFEWLAGHSAPGEVEHRRRYTEHEDARRRDAVAGLLEEAAPIDGAS